LNTPASVVLRAMLSPTVRTSPVYRFFAMVSVSRR
jgi:hypothetical protein